jgi:coenzyme F420-0:L-glutamate ligase / coenzyme F420-1:gamma-L-glutamate ligase
MPSRPRADLRILPIAGIGEIRPGDILAEKILAALRRNGLKLLARDILVVTHKIVSKSEGRLRSLSGIRPSARARTWARRHHLDPRLIELALAEGRRVVRMRHGVLITETAHGLVCANSGVDLSNVDGGRTAVLLPSDPDRSAAQLHREFKKKLGLPIPVIIADTFGRPWREGVTEVAIGVAGMSPFRDFRGRRDAHGYLLKATLEATADELACAAGLVCGKLSRVPACIIRGFNYAAGNGRAAHLVRPAAQDLFR